MKPIEPSKAKSRLANLCARQELCTGEAKKKLFTWGVSGRDAEEIINELIDQRYIDDVRFCRAYINDKIRFARWGKIKVRLGLIQKGIDRQLISETLDGFPDDEYLESLKKTVSAKARTVSDISSYESKSKIYRFAMSRGFEPNLIGKAIDRLITDKSSDNQH